MNGTRRAEIRPQRTTNAPRLERKIRLTGDYILSIAISRSINIIYIDPQKVCTLPLFIAGLDEAANQGYGDEPKPMVMSTVVPQRLAPDMKSHAIAEDTQEYVLPEAYRMQFGPHETYTLRWPRLGRRQSSAIRHPEERKYVNSNGLVCEHVAALGVVAPKIVPFVVVALRRSIQIPRHISSATSSSLFHSTDEMHGNS